MSKVAMLFAVLALAASLAACGPPPQLKTVDETSFFGAIDESTYEFRATANEWYPEDSETAEELRIEWLEEQLEENSLCKKGYEILDRRVVLLDELLTADLNYIYYHVRCLD